VRSRTPILTAVCLLAAAPPAQAYEVGTVAGPLIIIAAAVGALGGVLAGARRLGPGAALGSSFAAFAAITLLLAIVQASQKSLSLGEFVQVALLGMTLISFAGAIPLALAFFVAFRITAFVHRRRDNAKGASGRAP